MSNVSIFGRVLGAVVVGLLLIAYAVYASTSGTYELFRIDTDRTYGAYDAKTRIILFSDIECPFCRDLNPILKRLVDESEGTLALQYRHFPLPIHRQAFSAAVASECVATMSTSEIFYDYIETLYSVLEPLERELYVTLASSYGLDRDAFRDCLDNDEVRRTVESDIDTAKLYGGTGTPFSVVVFEDGTIQPVSGALPYEYWHQLVTKK